MSLLIQPRHVKLWLAGKQENWPLAGYALKEIRQSFARITAGVPHYNGAPVADLIETAMGEPMTLIDFAIKAGEPRQFAEQYAKLTAGCNACHGSTGHPYIVLKTPDGAAFANQEFQPKR
jgi:cytochrome c553